MKKVAAIILAAGYSRRFGNENKLLADLHGKAVLTHVLDKIKKLPFVQRLVVVNQDNLDVASLCDPKKFDIIENENAENGMGNSIAKGVRHSQKADGLMIALGDMPFIREETYMNLVDAFSKNLDKTIYAPLHKEQRGHPVLFSSVHADGLRTLNGDVGAKLLIDQNEHAFMAVSTNDAGVLRDIDTRSELY